MSRKVNLNAYFERIGFAGSIAATLPTLELLHALHPATIPFENLDPLLGLPVRLDQDSLERKLLAGRRGGYCFEHNTLLMSVLRELDFSVRGLAARVVRMDPEAIARPATHMVLAVDIGGTTYLADVGFGGLSLTAPLKLRADIEQATPHETFRLTGGAPDWQLEVKLDEDWQALYVFTLDEQQDADYAAANALVSGDPSSKFTRELGVALSPGGQRITLAGNRLTVRNKDEAPVVRRLETVAALRETLVTIFGIDLPDAALLDPALERVLDHAPRQDG
ncbi:arylamine N-acetyltransferase [uncultured Devosia sp.]|uniref:arylamine N-acetyltransferase family protein n=1 Tax=uncultured Devosia sp. TaxID=211434 RepID=UPI0035C995AD